MIHTIDSLQAIFLVVAIIELLLLPFAVLEWMQDRKRKKVRILRQKGGVNDGK